MENLFPDPIKSLPEADIPLDGIKAYLSQAIDHQLVFMQFEKDVDLPEHSHASQVGFVIGGAIELTVDGVTKEYRRGDIYYIPENVKHSGKIHAGYADITFFGEPDRYKAKKQEILSKSQYLIGREDHTLVGYNFYVAKNWIYNMIHFPDFMKNPKNKVNPLQQNTDDVEGYYCEGKDKLQMAFWECHSDQESEKHKHDFDEYMILVSGEYIAYLNNKKVVLKPGDELYIPRGTEQWGKCKAGTRSIHAFGGKRINKNT